MSHPVPSPSQGSHAGRVLTIATHTFTQLMRMKVFYFLAIFAVITIASNFFDLPQHEGPESVGANVLSQIKSWSLGAMHLFSVVLAIVATALLLPKDVEDRTLYTILAKPVPRAAVEAMGWPPDAVASLLAETKASGPNWSLQGATFAVFLRAAVMASLALLVSTFSSSTLFTTIVSFLIYFIGHFQADARDMYLQGGEAGEGLFARLAALLFALVMPDMQRFNVIDAVIEGQAMAAAALGQLTMVSAYYVVFFTVASWFVFSDKEF